MSILKIALMGNPVLYQVAETVSDPGSTKIRQLVDDMRDTLEDIGGNGLAAPQVHINKRVVLYRIKSEQIPADSDMQPLDWQVLINPVVKSIGAEKLEIWERCLSIPGMHGLVPRYKNIELTAQRLDGSKLSISASGFHAMLLQHEVDHLDGIVYPMRMSKLNTLSFNSELGDKGFLIPRAVEEFV